jgi:iron complex outermembrane recepter protein
MQQFQQPIIKKYHTQKLQRRNTAMHNFKRTAMATAVLALLPAMSAQLASAQDTSMQLEEVVVTGTRKVGVSPTETLSPVDVIGGSVLANQATFDLTESLSKLSPAMNTQRYPIADGTAVVRPVTLRNLSPDHTLVLLNGTRRHRSAMVNLQIAPLGTVNQGSQAVDFAAFPSAAIKRVEILRDGASAQYGSDAIAGVVNAILKDDDEGFTISAQYGEYDEENDGERTVISANGGLSLFGNGFLNLTGEYANSDTTSRGVPRADAAAAAAVVGQNNVPYNGLGQRWGDPDIEAYKFLANSAYDVTETFQLFGHGTYMYEETEGGFVYRTPVGSQDYNKAFPARSTMQIDNDGDGLPDPAPSDLVNSLVSQGLNVDEYLTADASSDSGYSLLNPIAAQFPGGYSPLFGSEITDYELVFGGRGEINSDLTWNLRGRYGENEVKYLLEDSINPGLGINSPTSFEPGTITQEETGFNLDFVKTFDSSPINLAFGAEWRRETYEIEKGDDASRALGPTFAVFGPGSDSFQGYAQETEGSWDSDSWGVYVDAETDITDQWTVGAALRYEDYDEWDDSTDWKLSTRYDFTDSFAIRGTANTGFRAPSPGQVNTLNVTTSANAEGDLIPDAIYPIDHPVARVLGSTPLQAEESTSYTLGLVWTPGDRWEFTLDYYYIEIDDRIAVTNSTVGQEEVDALNAQGYENADVLLGTSAKYFTNGFDTEVSGIDLAASSWWDMFGGVLTTDLRYNYNEQDVKSVANNAKGAPSIGEGRVYDLENVVPESSAVLTLDYSRDAFAGLVRVNYYDEWSSTDGVFTDGSADVIRDYDGAAVVDVELRYTFLEHYTVAVGGENVFDEYPDDEQGDVLQAWGTEYAVTSPFGFNGAFWYARLSASF